MQSKLEKPKISGWRVGLFLDILHRGFDYSIPWDVVEDKVWKKLKRKYDVQKISSFPQHLYFPDDEIVEYVDKLEEEWKKVNRR